MKKRFLSLALAVVLIVPMTFIIAPQVLAVEDTWCWPLDARWQTVTSGFGTRSGSSHNGTDVSSTGIGGASVYPVKSGTVDYIGYQASGAGHYIRIRHGDTGYYSVYMHLQATPQFNRGDWVVQGQTVLGKVGSTGNPSGNVLHFEIHLGGTSKPINSTPLTINGATPTINNHYDRNYTINYITPDRIGAAPSNPVISIDKGDDGLYAINQDVVISVSAQNATGYVLGIDKDGSRLLTPDIEGANVYTIKFSEPGQYSVYASCYNSSGYIDSRRISFSVSDSSPSNPRISINKGNNGTYLQDENVTFSFSVTNSQSISIAVFKDEVHYVTSPELVGQSTWQTSFSMLGSYSAYVSGWNPNGYVDSEWIGFTVRQTIGPTSAPIVKTDKPVYTYGETVHISWNAVDGASDYWIDIWSDKYGHSASYSLGASTSHSWAFEAADYTVYISVANTAGSIVSEGVRFIVNSAPDPSPPPPSPPPGQSTNPNLDDASSWAQGHINDAVEKGFLTDELTVGFQTAITRGEFVRLAMSWLRYVTLMTDGQLVAAYGDPAHAGRTFADTSDPAILAAARLDITAGVGNGLFGVNDLFNREQAAVMLTKVFAILGADVSNAPGAGFTDINSASSWARNAINYVGTYGAMSGIGGGLFGPLLPFTREQSITVFNQMG